MDDSNIINALKIEAKNGLLDQQLSAVLINGKKMILKPCCNTTRGICRGNRVGSLHAEANIMMSYFGRALSYDKKQGWVLDKRSRSKFDLVVIRLSKTGDINNARPCHNCLKMMKVVGIRRVYYSSDLNQVICENVKNMVSIQASTIDKYIEQEHCTNYQDSESYYEGLLITYFPSIIRKYNLDIFIQYNLSKLLPNHTAVIHTNKHNTFILITNNKNKNIIKAIVIN